MIWAFRKKTLEVDLRKSIFSNRWFSREPALKLRQKEDGLKRPKTPTQTHSQTHGQTRGQTQIQAGLNAQGTHFEPVYSWR